MPYIVVEFAGQKKNGGYLSIDGDSQIVLGDDMMIYIDAGTHNINFSSKSKVERNMTNVNLAVGNYKTAIVNEIGAVDGNITETFSENSTMLLTVVSDKAGRILDLPKYVITEQDDESMAELDAEYEKRLKEAEDFAKKTAGPEFFLCLILGALGAHKFYRGKWGLGIIYLFTGGLFGFGWMIDTLVLLFRYIKSKRK